MNAAAAADTPAEKFRPHFEKVANGEPLTEEEAADAFDAIMEGGIPEVQLAGFLVAMKARGETVDEITGAVRVMRGRMRRVTAPEGAIDVVGTGGDAKGTYNISTATAFVLAGGGVPVAKHGNRAVSSKSGAADVLESLGVNLAATPEGAARALSEAGVAFLFAPAHHPAMRHAAPVRQGLRLRTIFNLLGPLSNPAGVRRQLVGVFASQWVVPLAQVLQRLGADHVWVVHGSDGLDELSTTGETLVAELKDGRIREFTVTPADVEVDATALPNLLAGTPPESAEAMRRLLDGEHGPFRDIVLLNAAAAFIVAGKARSLGEGAAMAAASLDQGKAALALNRLIAICKADQ
jgi:anthranilate phosphoribosyltransferase